MNKKYEIKLVQKPVIQHALVEVGKSVTQRLDELNIEKLVATDETIQSLKTLRANLNKELKDYEDQRKSIKTSVTDPYTEFEGIYKTEVSEPYKSAIDVLKDKITDFENKVKAKKKENIEGYFSELIVAEKVDFLKFSDTGLKIDLSTSEKQYKEKCNAFVQRVQDDVILINTMDHRAEMMVEYKSNGLNASAAIKTVNDRKEEEKHELERQKQKETQRRQNKLLGITMVYHDMTKTYNYVNDETIFIKQSEIENLSTEDFEKRFIELELKIKEDEKQKSGDLFNQPSAEKAGPPRAAKTVEAPKEVQPEKKEEILTATFEAKSTMTKLKALGQYMKDNQIEYKNI